MDRLSFPPVGFFVCPDGLATNVTNHPIDYAQGPRGYQF